MANKTLSLGSNPLFRGPSLMARAAVEHDFDPAGSSPSPLPSLDSHNPGFMTVPMASVFPDPSQPRKDFDSERLEELAASIKEVGLLSPILVREISEGVYQVVAGERRFRAHQLLGADTIRVVVDSGDSTDSALNLAKQIIENIQRQDLNPYERALAIGELRDKLGISIRDIAQRLGISKSMVQRSLEILNLPDFLKEALRLGGSESKILVIGQVDDVELQKSLFDQLSYLSRAQILEIVESSKAKKLDSGDDESHGGTPKLKAAALTPADHALLEEVRKSIGLRVDMTRSVKGGGSLTIEFYSDDDLSEIRNKLVSYFPV